MTNFWQHLAEHPYHFDLFATLRRIESLYPQAPRLGHSQRPQQDPLRLGQTPSTAFAPSTLAELDKRQETAKLRIFSFGLFGPNGPLPLALTEYAMERANHHGDETLTAFADIFHHRLIQLFYRAWASAQSTVSLDRPQEDSFTRHVASLVQQGFESQRERDSIPDHARWAHAGHLVRQVRNAEGLERILGNFFQTPARVEEFVRHWLRLPKEQRTRLGAARNARLGVDAVAGQGVLDRQHRIRVRLGPMRLEGYESLLPTGRSHRQLLDWPRSYMGIEYAWDVRLVLHSAEVPQVSLGGSTRLGWTSWLGQGDPARDRDDLILDPERIAASPYPSRRTACHPSSESTRH